MTAILEDLPPEKFLETDRGDLIRAGVACMHDIETVQAYVAYENQHDNRQWVQRMLAERATAIRATELRPIVASIDGGCRT